MDYTKTLSEHLHIFSKNIQNNWAQAIGRTYLGKYSKDNILYHKGLLEQLVCINNMINEAHNDETILITIGAIMSSHFYYSIDFITDTKTQELLQKLDNLFIDELSLPAHQTGYPSQVELMKDIKETIKTLIIQINSFTN